MFLSVIISLECTVGLPGDSSRNSSCFTKSTDGETMCSSPDFSRSVGMVEVDHEVPPGGTVTGAVVAFSCAFKFMSGLRRHPAYVYSGLCCEVGQWTRYFLATGEVKMQRLFREFASGMPDAAGDGSTACLRSAPGEWVTSGTQPAACHGRSKRNNADPAAHADRRQGHTKAGKRRTASSRPKHGAARA